MKNLKMNFATIKSLFVLVLLTVSTMSFGTISDTTSVKKGKETTKTLSKEEVEFFKDIETYYQATFVQPVKAEVIKEAKVGKIVVFNAIGGIIQEQDASKKPVNMNLLPKGAKFFMAEGDVKYFIIME